MAGNDEWEFLSDSSHSDCFESKLPLECSERLNESESQLPLECSERLNESESKLPLECSERLNESESKLPLECSERLNESSCSLSDSYSSMPPLMESNDGLILYSNQEVVQKVAESCHDPMFTLREYIAAVSLLALRQCKKRPSKKVIQHVKHVENRPMTRLYKKQLTELKVESSTVPSRPMTRLYKKQLGL